MEKRIRLYVRRLLFENFFQEANISSHYLERFNTRIKNAIPKGEKYDLKSNKTPNSIINRVIDVVKNIKKINFPVNDSYAIKLLNLNGIYKHLDLDKNGKIQIDKKNGKIKESIGDTIWIIIRENEIKTIFLRNSKQSNNIPDIQYYIKNSLNLSDFYNKMPKDKNGYVNFKMRTFDAFLRNKKNKQEILPKVNLSNGIWFIDEKNKMLIQKSKKGNKVTNIINDYESKLNDDDLMKVWNALENELVTEIYFK